MKRLSMCAMLLCAAGAGAEAGSTQAELLTLEKPLAQALSRPDAKTLVGLIHPERGVQVSVNARIGDAKVTLKRADLEAAFASREPRVWGTAEGSGEPITLTVGEFFGRYVSPTVAKVRAEGRTASVNRRVAAGGHRLEGLPPGVAFLEYHFAGTEKNGNHDWSSVVVVVERFAGQQYVVAILRDAWIP